MQMQASRLLSISPELTWQALNDPEILQQCIPGCERFEADPDAENTYLVTSEINVGPVNAQFDGRIKITDIAAPNSYTLNFDVQSATAGACQGAAKVTLKNHQQGVELHYDVEPQFSGHIAQLDDALLNSAAQSIANDFFKRFKAVLMADHDQEEIPAATYTRATPTRKESTSVPIWFWLIVLAAVVVGVVILG